MSVDPAHQHAVLLDQSEACTHDPRLHSADSRKSETDGDAPGVVLRVPATMPLYPASRARISRRRDLVAMPEQRAIVLSATRSPRRRWRAEPRTVAMTVMGVKVWPSWTCHSTLHACHAQSLDGKRSEVRTHVQLSWRKTSSTKGTPASTA